MSAEAAELARATAQRLEEKGWTRGKIGPTEGPNCLVGAISHESRAQRLTLATTELTRALEARVPIDPVLRYRSLACWNDMQTREDVVKLLLTTADELDFEA